jgi:hypothetical protein
MGFKDFLRRGSGMDLVAGEEGGREEDTRPSGVGVKAAKGGTKVVSKSMSRSDEKVLRQLELEVSRAIEKLEDIRDKLRVRRGY